MKAESFEVQPSDLKLNVRPRVAIRTVSPSPLLVIARTHATTSHGEENRVIETYIYTYIYTNIYLHISLQALSGFWILDLGRARGPRVEVRGSKVPGPEVMFSRERVRISRKTYKNISRESRPHRAWGSNF